MSLMAVIYIAVGAKMALRDFNVNMAVPTFMPMMDKTLFIAKMDEMVGILGVVARAKGVNKLKGLNWLKELKELKLEI